MVAGFLISILAVLLQTVSAVAAQTRQLCLACHPVHYVDRGVCTACHRGNPASDRKNIAHQQLIAGRYAAFTLGDGPLLREGERLLDQYACRRCHVIGGRGNRLSANLDQSVARKTPEALTVSILQPVQNMPDFHTEESRAVLLVNALLALSGRQAATPGAQRQVVHFDRTATAGKDLFSRKCGPCHRALTVRLGGVGQGDAGPNLSGLLSPHYPETFRDKGRWTVRDLGTWLKNPRKVRPGARMQPVVLTELEFRELVDILKVEGTEVE
ncbi:MAG TPA: selenite/tellurite reduction operon c-type cytochrome lipoprotein ExtS [Geothrix sp.]